MINKDQLKIIKISIESYKKEKEVGSGLKIYFLSKNNMDELISESIKKSIDDTFTCIEISEKFSKMYDDKIKIELSARERVVARSIFLKAIKNLESMQTIIPATAEMTPEIKKSHDFNRFISSSVREISELMEFLRKEKII